MTKIYLIRHAEAEGNVYRRLHGQYDSKITPNGAKQVTALQKRFESVPIDAVYASDLTRTCITAAAIYKPKGLELQRDARFREVNVGIWEDRPFGQLEREEAARMHAFSHEPYAWSVEGCETFPVYTGRFLEALDELAARHKGQTIAIFSHGMVLRGVLMRLFHPDARTAPISHCENTGVTCITWDDGKYTLDFMNDASHLPQEISTLGRQNWWRGGQKHDFNMWYRPAGADDAALLATLGAVPAAGDEKLIAMLGDAPIGMVQLRELSADTGGIVHLALLPERRGSGFGAQLIGCAVSRLRKCGKQYIELLTLPQDTPAKALFCNYGFEKKRTYIVPIVE
ncbi:MAG: GNAT family N-acetyltransferase [Oscillospiraceae bacterium]|jgi:probable phosphoglycerate mutase|nr:GNAT family N-acetyltransferase [Oscillospiraceae bacterium]